MMIRPTQDQLLAGATQPTLSDFVGVGTYPSPLQIYSSKDGVLEFEIDLQTIFRYNIINRNIGFTEGASALGGIVICAPNNTFDPATTTPPRVEVFVALGDDARLGYQVFNPLLAWTNKTTAPSIGAVGTLIPPDFNATIPLANSNAWYYTKTT